MATSTRTFPFRFDPRARPLLGLYGITAATAAVTVSGDEVLVRFGPFRLSTPLVNIADAEVTGPYSWWRAIGPRLSLEDRGATFGSTAEQGVCMSFTEPVPGLFPWGLVAHPNLTVTVAEPAVLAAALAGSNHPAGTSAGGSAGGD